MAGEPERVRQEQGRRHQEGHDHPRIPEPPPIGADGQRRHPEGGTEDEVGELRQRAQRERESEPRVAPGGGGGLDPDQRVHGRGGGREYGHALREIVVDEPPDGQEQEQRERRERGEPRLDQDPPRRQVREGVRDGEHRVLEAREAGDARPGEADGRPHEPRVERRLARLVAPREILAEDRLTRVVDVQDRREPHAEGRMPDRVGGKENGEGLRAGPERPAAALRPVPPRAPCPPCSMDRRILPADRHPPEHAPGAGHERARHSSVEPLRDRGDDSSVA